MILRTKSRKLKLIFGIKFLFKKRDKPYIVEGKHAQAFFFFWPMFTFTSRLICEAGKIKSHITNEENVFLTEN